MKIMTELLIIGMAASLIGLTLWAFSQGAAELSPLAGILLAQ